MLEREILQVPSEYTLTNKGTITNYGTINNDGTIQNEIGGVIVSEGPGRINGNEVSGAPHTLPAAPPPSGGSTGRISSYLRELLIIWHPVDTEYIKGFRLLGDVNHAANGGGTWMVLSAGWRGEHIPFILASAPHENKYLFYTTNVSIENYGNTDKTRLKDDLPLSDDKNLVGISPGEFFHWSLKLRLVIHIHYGLTHEEMRLMLKTCRHNDFIWMNCKMQRKIPVAIGHLLLIQPLIHGRTWLFYHEKYCKCHQNTPLRIKALSQIMEPSTTMEPSKTKLVE